LLRALHDTLGQAGVSDVEEALAVLQRADAAAPAVVDALISRPLFDAWASRCVSGLRERGSSDPVVAADIAFLRSVAAAAGVQAGLRFELRTPAPAGRVFLPGLGGVVGLGGPSALVRGDGGSFEVVGAGTTVAPGRAGWRPGRELTLGGANGWRLEVEDQDPYRDCFGYIPADYLWPAGFAELGTRMDAAWSLIETDQPAYAATIRHTLRSVVPIADTGAGGFALTSREPPTVALSDWN